MGDASETRVPPAPPPTTQPPMPPLTLPTPPPTPPPTAQPPMPPWPDFDVLRKDTAGNVSVWMTAATRARHRAQRQSQSAASLGGTLRAGKQQPAGGTAGPVRGYSRQWPAAAAAVARRPSHAALARRKQNAALEALMLLAESALGKENTKHIITTSSNSKTSALSRPAPTPTQGPALGDEGALLASDVRTCPATPCAAPREVGGGNSGGAAPWTTYIQAHAHALAMANLRRREQARAQLQLQPAHMLVQMPCFVPPGPGCTPLHAQHSPLHYY